MHSISFQAIFLRFIAITRRDYYASDDSLSELPVLLQKKFLMKHASHGFFVSPPKLMILSCLVSTWGTLSIYLSDVFYGSSPLLRVSSSPRSQCHHQLIYSWRVSFILDDSSWILVLDVVCTRKRLLGASLGGLMSVTQSHRFRHCSGRFFFSF